MLFRNSFSLRSLICIISLWLPVFHGHAPKGVTLDVGSGIKDPPVYTEKCIQKDTCSCVRKNRTVIDLHFLNTGPKPRFNFTASKRLFLWNPCTGFKATGINDVSVAAGNDQQSLFVYGIQQTASFNIEDGTDVIKYIGESGSSRIVLQCNENSEPRIVSFSFVGDQDVLALYNGPCTEPKGSSLSYGSMMLIALLVVIVVYFAVGFVVNTKVHKAVGLERIPNYEFWSNLPSLIKDGWVFMRKRKKGYESV